MKGIARTQKEIEFHDRVAQLGCISCRQEGNYNPWVSIHHAHGRTKPGCHMWVLPLCEPHHQNNGTATARHPYKRRWEAKYGKEDDLIRQQWEELGVEFKEPERKAKPVVRDRPNRATSPQPETGSSFLKPERPAKPKVEKPVRDKIPKPVKQKVDKPVGQKVSSWPKAKKPEKTDKQIAYLEDQKAEQKRLRVLAAPGIKAQAKARQAEYLEANKETIQAQKDKAKAIQKKFRQETAARMKNAS